MYLLALGGNPGLSGTVNNSRLALMAGLGACSSLLPTTVINIDEVTTAATAYALAAFMTTETQVGTSSTNVAGLANAFGNLSTLVNVGSGTAYVTTPAGNGTVPQAELNTLGNILAPCVNSDGTGSACASLMSAANVTGSNGTPVDTVQAMLNIAHAPGTNVSALYNLSSANAPFQPTLTTLPNDWTLQVAYTGTLNQVQGIAIDSAGNVYVSNSLGGSLTEFSPNGSQLQTLSAPYLYRPQQIGIDLNGNIWVASRTSTNYAANLAEFSSSGALLSGANGFTGGGLAAPRGLAIDNRGNVWANGNGEVSEFTPAGQPVSGTGGYTNSALSLVGYEMNFDSLGNAWIVSSGNASNNAVLKFTPVSASSNQSGVYGGTFTQIANSNTVSFPHAVALDASNNAWVANQTGGASQNGSLTEYTENGTELSPTQGYVDGGISAPQEVVIDGLGYVYTTQDQISVRTASGQAVSPSTGYQTTSNDCCLAAAIDLSGDLWTSGVSTLFQWIGFANPVATPVVKNVVNGTLGTRP